MLLHCSTSCLQVCVTSCFFALASKEDYRLAFLMSAGATLTQSIVSACEEEPQNRHVLRVKENNLENVIIMRGDTVSEIATWVKNQANRYHGGVAYTMTESMEDTEVADKAWEAHRKEHGIFHANCPSRGEHTYEKIKARYLVNAFPQWPKPQHFINANACRNTLIKYGLYEEAKLRINAKADYVDGNIDNDIALRNIDLMVKKVFGFADAHSGDVLKLVALCAIDFCYATSGEHELGRMLFDKVRTDLISRFDCPMIGSKVLCSKTEKQQLKQQQTTQVPAVTSGKIAGSDADAVAASDGASNASSTPTLGADGKRRRRSNKGVNGGFAIGSVSSSKLVINIDACKFTRWL
jgi:hypothetical protein